MYMMYIWLAVLCIGLIVEAIDTGNLVSIWFSVGAIVPFVMSFWKISTPIYIIIQFIVFGVVTSLCLIFLRKLTKKLLFKGTKEKTNLDMYVGKKFSISNKYGNKTYIKFNGIEYSAILENDDNVNDLEIGDKVEIIRFEGNGAVVKKI